jgi:hypothetical protein
MADEFICKYCGQKFTAGFSCNQSPNKKHQLIEDKNIMEFLDRYVKQGA